MPVSFHETVDSMARTSIETRAVALVSFLLAWGLFAPQVAVAEDKLNVLVVTADDLGPQLACYGDQTVPTRNIDSLAAQSVQFQTAYVSQASCSPSRSTMFTGLYPHSNGHYGLANANVGFQVHRELYDQLLPNVLKRSGYRTGIIGKLHVNPEKQFQFDYREGQGFGSREVAKQVQFASKFIDEASDEPWFLMFNMFDPHVARDRKPNGQRGLQYFPDQVAGLPRSPISANDVSAWPWQQIDTPQQRVKIAGYYNCVQRIDVAMGMLLALLKETGNWDKTLVIFLGDHGPPFARGKTSCYEAGLRVPFLVRWPGVSQPHVSNRLAASADIYPTILDAAGINLGVNVHGKSLRPVLSEAGATWREYLAAEFHYHGATPFFPRRAIRDARYKLIHNIRSGTTSASPSVDGDQAHVFAATLPVDNSGLQALERLHHPPEWELYDLQEDPHELDNLAAQASHAQTLDRLKQALTDWQTQTEDPFTNAEFRESIMQKYR
ncbi:MAG TPA: hypothetical protein DDW52_10725 [Planctomycetaceae bacterium]|nr:hypothetical protein [Planctomycetaceae bacterium]